MFIIIVKGKLQSYFFITPYNVTERGFEKLCFITYETQFFCNHMTFLLFK